MGHATRSEGLVRLHSFVLLMVASITCSATCSLQSVIVFASHLNKFSEALREIAFFALATLSVLLFSSIEEKIIKFSIAIQLQRSTTFTCSPALVFCVNVFKLPLTLQFLSVTQEMWNGNMHLHTSYLYTALYCINPYKQRTDLDNKTHLNIVNWK